MRLNFLIIRITLRYICIEIILKYLKLKNTIKFKKYEKFLLHLHQFPVDLIKT